MLNRWIGITCLFCMLSANTALLFHDFVPDWLAGDPPDSDNILLQDGQDRKSQVGIFDARGRCVGRSWTIADGQLEFVRVRSWTVLYPVSLPNGMATPHVRIDTELLYQREGTVDRLSIRLHWKGGAGPPVALEGEFMPPDDFPCQWRIGNQRGKFILRAAATRAIGDVFRPFDRLPGLYVGRTWRLNLVDPLSEILHGTPASNFGMEPILVKVDREETIEFEGRLVETLHVSSGQGEAWVARDGRVLLQVIEAPLLGRLTLRAETYDDAARKAGVTSIHGLD
ncbi:MAG: hypothetical protein IH986_04310 [Planctomycetes bacterium]|nr:hypothetical protein [Planctomycetota bacterium]